MAAVCETADELNSLVSMRAQLCNESDFDFGVGN